MKTVVSMITIGPGSYTRTYAVARAKEYAARFGYDFVQLSEGMDRDSGRTPHWEKLLVPRALPDYDRWLIIDDDVLINTRRAPALPELVPGTVGMAKEPVPTKFPAPIRWLGNSGVLLLDRSGLDLLEEAYRLGEIKTVEPGYGDQPAMNVAAWREARVTQLDGRWNYLAMADWLQTVHGQEHPWTKNLLLGRLAKLTLFWRLGWASVWKRWHLSADGPIQRLGECYAVHLTWFRMGARLVNHYLE